MLVPANTSDAEDSLDESSRVHPKTSPAPEGPWYKDFGSFKICGEAEFPLILLLRGRAAKGRKQAEGWRFGSAQEFLGLSNQAPLEPVAVAKMERLDMIRPAGPPLLADGRVLRRRQRGLRVTGRRPRHLPRRGAARYGFFWGSSFAAASFRSALCLTSVLKSSGLLSPGSSSMTFRAACLAGSV